jgi:DNA helicase II / ATP-dependent DNA helicase PcrA
MDITSIIEPLNPAQRQAVCAGAPSALVLAGAGSGKTRVLVHRMAWLFQAESVSPQRVLAVTFTNKAAREMKNRIEDLLGLSTHDLWIGTFHGLCHRLLRRHSQEAGLPHSFQILDTDDQLRIVKRIIRGEALDESRWPARQVLWFINAQKEEGRRARNLPDSGDPFERQMIKVYRAYEDLCDRSGLVDFAELLLRGLELFEERQEILDFYRQKFQYVLVDEFQDTNRIQYAWLSLLTNKDQNLFVVGDDDQSIYSWRGAQVENLQKFQRDYPSHSLIRLEQNYRSTGNILAAANALISHNSDRLGKELWTDDSEGEAISLYTAFNEVDEAHFVTRRIQTAAEQGHLRSEMAILYRSNAQSRQFEEKLVTFGIPYRVYGGLRFFERQEIKDALAYLRMTGNPDDDASFERIINTPVRGIGPKSLDLIRGLARQDNISLWRATHHVAADPTLPARARNPLNHFIHFMTGLIESSSELGLSARTSHVLSQSGLLDHYKKERGEQAEQRLENLAELVNATRQFENEPLLDQEISLTDQFLAHAALESGESQSEPSSDCVQLMTLHAAKGLEFEQVYLVGLEEGLFPSLQSMEDPSRLEEERRLCYVGLTRARKKLVISHAESRRLYGKESYPRPSRFLREIPANLIEPVRMGSPSARAMGHGSIPASEASTGFRIGQQVQHAKFGTGVILHAEGEGSQARVQVSFSQHGVKWLMLAYAALSPVEG